MIVTEGKHNPLLFNLLVVHVGRGDWVVITRHFDRNAAPMRAAETIGLLANLTKHLLLVYTIYMDIH
jgi:hypothetical protein